MESGSGNQDFAFDRYDTYDWYLALGPLANVNERLLPREDPDLERLRRPPGLRRVLEAPDARPPHPQRSRCRRSTSPAGGTRRTSTVRSRSIRRWRSTTRKGLNRLVVGPWNHGGWRAGAGRPTRADRLRQRDRRSSSARRSRRPWFAYYLKDKGALDLPEALTFEAGSNRWRRWDAWPPTAKTERAPSLLRARPARSRAPAPHRGKRTRLRQLRLRPAHPVPYRRHPIQATYFPGRARSGARGSWRTSASSTTARTC